MIFKFSFFFLKYPIKMYQCYKVDRIMKEGTTCIDYAEYVAISIVHRTEKQQKNDIFAFNKAHKEMCFVTEMNQ